MEHSPPERNGEAAEALRTGCSDPQPRPPEPYRLQCVNLLSESQVGQGFYREPGFPVCGPVPGGPAVPRGSAERSPKGLPPLVCILSHNGS